MPVSAVTSFALRLGKQTGVYFSGETVHGEVILDLAEPINTKGIRVKANGKAELLWTWTYSSITRIYSNKETYVKRTIMVGGQENHNITIQQGQHIYPFQIQLPVDCPSTFKGRHGHIGYYFKAELLRTGLKSNSTTRIGYTVVRNVDVKLDPGISQPVELTQTEMHSRCCAGSGLVTGTLGIDRTGFLPGETANITVAVNNQAGFVIAPFLQLVQDTVYYSNGGSYKCDRDMVYARLPANTVAGGNGYRIQTQVEIPELPTELYGCTIMGHSVTLKLKVNTMKLKVHRGNGVGLYL